LKSDSEGAPAQVESALSVLAELPEDVQAWLAQAPSDVIARWRMEMAAGLRDDDGKLTCANLHDPNASISEARRISDALMEPVLRKWLATPVHDLLEKWRAHR